MESLFLAYNDECDSARVNHIRKQLLATERYRVEGYMPFTTWSKTKLGCSSDEIQRMIEEGVARASATLIMIGPDAAANTWIRYAIERSYTLNKPMLALYINALPDERGCPAEADINPLERFAVLEHGHKVYLDERYRSYTWNGMEDGQFELWLELAKCECTEFRSRSQISGVHAVTMPASHTHTDADRTFNTANL